MKIHISKILKFLTGEGYDISYNGDEDLSISGFCALSNLKSDSVTWIKKMENFDIDSVDETRSILFITNAIYSGSKKYNIISCDNPKAVYFTILDEYFADKMRSSVAGTSVVLTKDIGENVSIGHNCFIGENVKIGNNTIIRNGVIIECPAIIGEACIIESGTVIGCAGYGYYTDNSGNIRKVPDLGGVIIGDRVEIGANTCIARGTLEDTIIGHDVKIDNLCHIAHNVQIKDKCYVVALSLIGGSVTIERDAYIAPGAMIMNQTKIGENAFIGMGSVVTKDVEDNKVVVGVPAKVLRDNRG